MQSDFKVNLLMKKHGKKLEKSMQHMQNDVHLLEAFSLRTEGSAGSFDREMLSQFSSQRHISVHNLDGTVEESLLEKWKASSEFHLTARHKIFTLNSAFQQIGGRL